MQHSSNSSRTRQFVRSALSMMIVVGLYGCADSSDGGGGSGKLDVPTVYLGAATPSLTAVRYTSPSDSTFSGTVRTSGYTTLNWMPTDAELYEVYRRSLNNQTALTLRAASRDGYRSICDDIEIFNDVLGGAIVPAGYEFVGVSSSYAFVDDTLTDPGTYRYMVVALDGQAGPEIVGRDLTIEVPEVVDIDASPIDAGSGSTDSGSDTEGVSGEESLVDEMTGPSTESDTGTTPDSGAAEPVTDVESKPDTAASIEGANPFESIDQTPIVVAPVAETSATEETVSEETPVKVTPVEETPVEETPVEETPVKETPVKQTPVEETPVEETTVEETPVEETPVEETPVEETPVEETPVEETLAEQIPVEETVVEQIPVEETVVEETLVEQIPVTETPVTENQIDEIPVEETPAEANPVTETPVAETAVEEIPVEVQSVPVESVDETPVICEPSPSEPVSVDSGLEGDPDGGEGVPPLAGEPEVVAAALPDADVANKADTQLLAFPGAVGHGRNASGGRDGRVVIVDTLENRVDAGDGKTSLREALEVMNGARIITFAVGGVFDTGNSLVKMSGSGASDVTIACQTAPSPGVIIKGLGIRIQNGAHNVIMRHCTIRNIDPGRPDSESSRAITVAGTKASANDMIFDHLSLSWSTDENWTVFMGPSASSNSARFTLSNSIVAEGDADSSHAESGQLPSRYLHAMGPSCNSASSTYRINECSIISNLIAHNGRRNPLMWGVSGELIDNRIYNWHETALDARPWKNGRLEMHVIDNEFKAGPTSKQGNDPFKVFGDAPSAHVRISGNRIVSYPGGSTQSISDRSSGSPSKGASVSAGFDAECVGASRPGRDVIDSRIVNEYQNASGQVGIFNNHKRDYSMYQSSKWDASHDTDRDGMADSWELGAGLDPNNSDDYRGDLDADGYTNLEEYINGLAECG